MEHKIKQNNTQNARNERTLNPLETNIVRNCSIAYSCKANSIKYVRELFPQLTHHSTISKHLEQEPIHSISSQQLPWDELLTQRL